MLLATLSATITAAPNPAVGYLIDYLGKIKHHTTSSSVRPLPVVATYSPRCVVNPAPGVEPTAFLQRPVLCDSLPPAAAPAAPGVTAVPAAPTVAVPLATSITNVRYY